MEYDDSVAAEEILRFALFKEILKREKKQNKRRKLNDGRHAGSSDGESEGSVREEDDEGGETAEPEGMSSTKGGRTRSSKRVVSRAQTPSGDALYAAPPANGPVRSQEESMDLDESQDIDSSAPAIAPERYVRANPPSFRFSDSGLGISSSAVN